MIEPFYPECTGRFRFLLDGKVTALDPADAAADAMISRLNLNHSELSKDRETILMMIDAGDISLADLWNESDMTAETLAHIVFARAGLVLP